MRTNVLNDLSNVVKKGAGLACSWSQVGRMSEGAPDEHPMSIRSASDGERWKPAGEKGSTRVWKHVAMIFAVLTLSIANIGMAWGTEKSINLFNTGSSYSISFPLNSSPVRICTSGSITNKNQTNSSSEINSELGCGSSKIYMTDLGSSGMLTINVGTGNKIDSIWIFAGRNSTGSSANQFGHGGFSADSATWTEISALSAKGYDKGSKIKVKPSGNYQYFVFGRGNIGKTAPSTNTETRIYKLIVAYSAASAGSTWYVKGGWNGWGTTDNLTGSGTELSATVNITTAGKYEFKIFDSTSSGTWWGNGGNIGCNVSGWTFESPGSNCTFFASETGNYTFTFNTSTKKLSVTYPTAQGKYYYKNTGSWGTVAVYRYVGGINNGWPGTQVVETETVCGDTYYFTYADPGTTLIFNNNDNGSQTGNMAASGNAGKYVQGTESSWNTFPTYSVTYNKNGDGAGGAGSVTGSVPTDGSSPYACGSTVTVLGNTGSLVRTGYNFIGWNTAANGSGASYTAGNTFTISANTTLYAQWELIPTYTVTYNANGGTGSVPTDATAYTSGSSVPVKDNTGNLAKSGYYFAGWNTKSDGSGTTYVLGETFSITANTPLYAKWVSVSCPDGSVEGTVFSLAMTTTTKVTVPAYSGMTMTSTHATINKGTATLLNGESSGKEMITNTTKIKFLNNTTVLRLNLGCALAEGDIISFANAEQTMQVCTSNTTSPSANNYVRQETTSSNCTIPEGSNLIGLKEVYVTRVSETSYFKGITITRPVSCTEPTTALSNGTYIISGSALDLRTLISGNNSSGAITYSITNANGTGATLAGDGYSFSATTAGTANIRASQAANGDKCEKVLDATIKVVPAPLGIVDQKLATGAVAWDASTIVTTDPTNITGLSAFAAQGGLTIDGGNGTTSSGTALTAKVEASGGTSKENSEYMEFHFTVASGKRLHVTAINAVVRSVSNDRVYYATLTGSTGSITKTTTVTEATSAGANIFEGQSYDEYFTGTVSFKLWAYSTSTQTKNLWYRIGSNIYITGTIEDDCTTPAAPTNFTAGSISATGATFTITDAADAASYDIYYSMSSTAPTSGTAATTTSTSKTKAVTGLTVGTTYYAWVRSVCDASHKSAWVALNPGGDTHTFATSCVAPTTVNVTATVNEVSGFWFYPDDDVVLTAAPTGSPAGSPVTYQWKKNGSNVGTNSATLTINDAAASDAGKYTCTISYGECSTTSAEFSLKCMQFYLKDSEGADISNHALTKVDATHATLILNLTGGTTYKFRITDGCGDWYGNSGTMTSSDCTNWTMPDNTDASMTTGLKTANYTFNFDFTGGLLGSQMKVSIVYPGGDQAAGKVIYWDNSVLNWDAGDQWYRIGKSDHHTKTQMTLVPGTANLYKVTTAEYNGFEYWHIANNDGNGTGNLFWTKGDAAHAITNAMAFEGAPVTADAITITPTTSHATGETTDNDNCEFYTYGQTPGMKRDRVTITAPVNGTITVNYTSEEGVASSFSATTVDMYQDLAHTVIITPTATPAEGYTLSGLTVNGAAHTSGNTYTVTANTTIAATFSPASYTVTLNTNDGTINAGNVTSYTYGTGATLPTNVTKSGFTFGGWYDNSGLTGSAVTTISTTATGNKEYWAKWTAAASLTAISADVLYQAASMANITFTGEDQNFTGLSTNNLFKVYGTDGNAAKGKNENHNVTDDISTKNFTSALYILSNSNTTSTDDPTQGAIEIITPSTAGLLYLYLDANNSSLTLKKKGTKTSTSLSGATYKAMTVDANTHYFINGSSSGKRGLYGIQYVSTYAVTITPTNVTKATGATGAGAAIKGKAYTATFTANTGYTLPSDVTVSIGGVAQTKGAGYTWTVSSGTGTLTVPVAQVTGNIVITVTGTAAATYSLTYNCNGAESGCPSNTTASALPNPLPTGLTKDGYDFGGWFTDSECTVAAIAGATLTGNIDLYAKWTVHSASECITITNFATSNTSCSNNIPDNNSKYFYGYKGTVDDAHAVTITSNDGNDRGQNSGVEMRLTYNKKMRIYANNTTNATPAGFENVVSVSFKWKFIASGNSGNTELTSSYTVKVGSTTIANAVSITGKTNDGYATVTIDNLAQLNGYIEFLFGGSSSSYNVYLDDIQICTADMASCTTPTLPTATLNDQALCEGADIAAWDATPTNASTITGKGESISYSWKKKSSSTELANTATFDLGASAAESQAGTYVVTVTVSKTGYASSTATKEVTLSVTDGIEVTGITADKATVYPTNSVTLTATASASATWQWYTCTNAEGAGESSIGGATSASYTITAPASAGTYYYKVKATGSCGTGSMVYTLTVSAAAGGDCFHYVSVLPDKDISPSSGASIVTPTHATTLEGGTMKVGSQQITITKNGLKLENSKTVTITLDAALEAGNVVIVKGTAASAGNGVSINGVNFYDEDNKSFDVSYTVLADDGLVGKTALTVTKYSGSSYLQEIKITGCGASCTDPEVTASVNNSTACVGSSVTFTATGAHASATYQWQKYSGGAWTNIADATAATYNIASVATTDAMKYRVIASHECNRTSNEVTLNVPVAPVFNSFTATRSVMATLALSITDVEASDATSYAWYKSADATYDAGTDTRVGTAQELLLASGGEAAGATYYLFCVASNACGSTTSSAITVNVTAFIEEDCATRGTEGAAEFGFQNSGCSQGTYNGTAVWSTGTSNSKILIYSAPDGKYFKTMKVTIASSSASKASYNWSTDGGTTYTSDGVAITGVTTTLTEKTIDLSAHGNVNEVKIGRNFGNGESSGTLYVSKICFEYTSACTATTVTPSAPSKSHTIGASFTAPTFTLGPAAVSSGTLTYSSSDEEIASVDESGNVTFNGTAGTVTITASYAGATIADVDYCASEGSYTITVSCEGGAPKIVAASSVNMSGCNSSVTLNAKTQAGADFAGGSYQWFRNGEEIAGATSKSYTASQTGVYTVAYTSAGGCTSLSTNNATVTSTTVEPEITKLVPFQYYHVDKTYTAQMKDRHLFSVKGSAAYGSTGKNFKLTMSRNGEAETDITTEASIWVERSDDGQVDNVMIDLNKLSGKYSEGDELVLTCAAVDCSGSVSTVYKDEITIHVIGATPTLALICSGTDIAAGTRDTKKLTVGGDFLTGYNKADLCQQTGNTSFDANTEWGLYTRLKENYIVTPVNGYAVFNKLNYEPFDILLLTDYPKASKSDAAATVLDDMADLCDYRPMLSFKAHMVSKTPSKWAAKGFTTSPVVPKNTRTRLNIVCYAHPMFSTLKSTATHIQKDNDDPSQIVYTMLTGAGYESSKGLQGFELEAAENFVTIGLVHYNATPADGSPSAGLVTWTPGSEDRMLVTAVERQENPEARMIMFAVNCGAQSKFTETGRNVVLKCLEYLLTDATITPMADCSFTFDNGAGNSRDAAKQAEDCPSCTGTKGDGKWSTAANWGPDYVVRPGKDTEVKIAASVTVDPAVGAGAATNFTPIVRSVRILEGGQVTIPSGSYLEVVSTIRRQDGNDIYPTEVEDLHIGSSETGNGTLIFNNSSGDTKAHVGMYSKGFIDGSGNKNYQYMGVPCVDINAAYNYYGSWIYSWSDKGGGSYGWKKVVNGGIVTTWTGYCITQESAAYYDISGKLAATGTVDIDVPANENMVVGNSWTAPIDLGTFTTTDFENMDANVYFFNTGIDKEGTGTVSENATGETRWAAGTYVTVPVLSAEYTGEDDHIPSLQGFFVKSNGSAGTLHLDYDKHVRGSSRAGRLSGPLHAPRRANAQSDEPAVLKIKVSGEKYDDKLLLLEREDFTTGFDNGWDGDKWDGNESALYIYTKDEAGTENSVSAIPEMEGTVIGFRAGEDDAYTLHFEYLNSAEELYLFDTETNAYTKIMTGATYRFFTDDKEKHDRFVITRKSPQIATDVDEVDSGKRREVRKLLIEDKMYILLNGALYDATGKVVK